MTTTDTQPHPLAGAIPAELCARMKAHDVAAGRWLEPFMDWCDKYVVLRDDFTEAAHDHPLNHIDGMFDELARVSGFSRLELLTQLVDVESSRMDALNPDPLCAELCTLAARS